MNTVVQTLLSVNNYHYRRSGAEVLFLSHNDLFTRNGWTVTPFSMRHASNLPSEYEEFFVDEIEYGNRYSALGSVKRAMKVIYSVEAQRKLRALMSGKMPAVAHCHCIYHHISPSIMHTLAACGVPTVMTLHDLKIACPAYYMSRESVPCHSCKSGNFRNVIRHRCIKGSLALSAVVYAESTLHRLLGSYTDKVDLFVSPSRFYIEVLTDWGFPAEKFRHIPNFIDATGVRVKGRPGSYFAYAGRLSREKGVAVLVEAAAMAGQEVLIAGDGPERVALEKQAAVLGAPVRFLGTLAAPEVLQLMSGSRATVLPSVWYENFPMSVLESFATATPVIGARIGGIPELVQSGATGELFEPGDAASLAELLNGFAQMSNDRVHELGRNGRLTAATKYNPNTYYTAMASLYRELWRQS